ncbi:MAG: hypothetical protein RSC43_07165 [Clostridia bacterium]
MSDDNFGRLDSYEVTEQKVLDDSDSSECTSNTEKSLSGKQLCCMGQPVGTGRAVAGVIVLFIGAIIIVAVRDRLNQTALGCFIGAAGSIGMLVASFKIMLGGKSK